MALSMKNEPPAKVLAKAGRWSNRLQFAMGNSFGSNLPIHKQNQAAVTARKL